MYFNTLAFLTFFIFTYAAFRWVRRSGPGLVAYVLLSASVAFYIVAGVFDTLLILSVLLFNWLIIALIRTDRARVIVAVAGNIGVLAVIKYRALLFGGDVGGTSFVDTVLPLGISFYTFQLLAYQVDAARDHDLKSSRDIAFPLFITFFPQLIAGPIVRARQMLPQIKRIVAGRGRTLRLYTLGLGLCVLGLTKKIVFADSLAPVVDDIFFLDAPTTYQAWLGAWLFSFQIYFDFSGYSDIALGCAYLLGVRLPLNFRTPYLSISPREFWQRWHITLSTWIRDYLYIPLGGNAGGRVRQAAVLLFVMGLAGLWHGADFSFVVWGLGWGLYIALHRTVAGITALRAIPGWVMWPAHMLVIVVLWVFFRASDLDKARSYFAAMFSFDNLGIPERWAWTLLGCALLMALHVGEARFLQNRKVLWRMKRCNGPFVYGLFFGLCLWLVMLPSYDVNPFIYFRF